MLNFGTLPVPKPLPHIQKRNFVFTVYFVLLLSIEMCTNALQKHRQSDFFCRLSRQKITSRYCGLFPGSTCFVVWKYYMFGRL